ncbi:hypothetical protein BAE44_0024325 [Dichanthelium oligosanthes]|uniref:DUF3615 domain-containing protein n=1 Tax=Dichanthelium oligosanthes TaxID=888268 RepID=A0A1E5UP62_9POAL|nr:hypothetical protein BAE44_0024325 [Dichanthelium oligosanthes]
MAFRPDYTIEPCMAVRQDIEFAETALQYHNDDPSNEVKYELIKAITSNYMFYGSGNYGHVNFTARAKQENSEEQLFFAELNLRGDFTTLTCFRCLKEKEDQIGGLKDTNREGSGVDKEHCYLCEDALKHPRDGASYHAGHSMGR